MEPSTEKTATRTTPDVRAASQVMDAAMRPLSAMARTSRVLISSLLPADSPRLEGESLEHVQMLAETNTVTRPILVHGSTMRVIDGMHRLRAAVLRGEDSIDVEFLDGSDAEAFVRAVQANIAHGLPLSLNDRKAAAARIAVLYPHWSDRAIAHVAGLSPKTVATVRRCASEESPHSHSRVGRDGRVRRLNNSEGRQAARDMISLRPDASLRQVAQSAGISISTARNIRQQMARSVDDPLLPEPENEHDRHRGHALPSATRPGERTPQDKGSPCPLSTVKSLMNDPSLRFTQPGRALLRLLAAQAILSEDCEKFLDAIPSHWVSAIADLADTYAKAWKRFETELSKRR